MCVYIVHEMDLFLKKYFIFTFGDFIINIIDCKVYGVNYYYIISVVNIKITFL